MANLSKFKTAFAGAAVAAMLVGTVVPSQAAGLWGERFSALRSGSFSTNSFNSGWKWQLVQYRAYKYDQIISRFLGRPVSPFCRLFCS